MTFWDELGKQRWDDHRFYHHSRINQTLHFFSACCFLVSYVTLLIDPVIAVMVGWLLAMVLRQVGHFFFEPKSYDRVNDLAFETKESIKVGYNLKRKIVLLSIWVLSPVLFFFDSSLWGLFEIPMNLYEQLHNISLMWLAVAVGGLTFRTVQLFFVMNVRSGLVWLTKILTDPFHDIKIYHKSLLHLWRGEKYDDMSKWYNDNVFAK